MLGGHWLCRVGTDGEEVLDFIPGIHLAVLGASPGSAVRAVSHLRPRGRVWGVGDDDPVAYQIADPFNCKGHSDFRAVYNVGGRNDQWHFLGYHPF